MIALPKKDYLSAEQILSTRGVSLNLSKEEAEKYSFYINRNLVASRHRKVLFVSPGVAERDHKSTDRRRAMGVARRKIEESPMAQGILKVQADNIVGSGFRLSMKTSHERFNKEVESRWLEARDRLDARGLRRWGRLQRMWWSRQFTDGDVSLVKTISDGCKIMTVEADRLRRMIGDTKDDGIDYDDLGAAIRYWFGPKPKDQNDAEALNKEGTPVEADKVIFYARFPGERADQKRGTSGFLANLSLFDDFEECLQGMVQKVKNHAFQTLNLRKDPAPDGSILGADVEETKDDEDSESRKHIKFKPGHLNVLDEGENIELLESNTPNSEFVPFLRYLTRYMGVSWGVPLEMILMDFSDTNFAGGRALMGLAKKGFMVEQDDLAFISSKVFEWWLMNEVTGGLKVPKSIEGQHLRHTWGKPKWPYLNPQQEIAAFGDAVDRGFLTHEEVIGEISEFTVDEVFEKLGREIEMKREHGIPEVSGSQGAVVSGEEETVQTDEPEDEPETRKMKAKFDGLKSKFDAYGVGVRAGSITPQMADEEAFRDESGLPPVSTEIRNTWTEEGGVRRPITLLQKGEDVQAPISNEDQEIE